MPIAVDEPTPRPLIAILRGIRPDEAVATGEALLDAGFGDIEVPLNSPDPFDSIARLVEALGSRARIGAGTVLSPADVERVASTGATLVVSPDANADVIRTSVAAGLRCVPGVCTPTEAFAALRAGAHALKVFPALQVGRAGVRAWRAVLPKELALYAVGGADAADFADWLAAGITGFGIGSALYRPGQSVEDTRAKARTIVAAYDAAVG